MMADVEEAMSRAHASGSPDDYRQAFESLAGSELYFPVSPENPEAIPLTPMADGAQAVRMTTSRDSEHLGPRYAGIRFENAIGMIVRMPDADGLIIQNEAGAWTAFNRYAAEKILASWREESD
jgi:hypothetical protein